MVLEFRTWLCSLIERVSYPVYSHRNGCGLSFGRCTTRRCALGLRVWCFWRIVETKVGPPWDEPFAVDLDELIF